VVRYGSYREHFPFSRKHYVYSREWEGEKLLVVCSFSNHVTKLKVPRGFDVTKAELILCNAESDSKELRPYECRVYRWRR